MTRKELMQRIIDEHLDAAKYNIEYNPMTDDEYGLIIVGDQYAVYLSNERGGYHIIEYFQIEEDACDRLYESMKAIKYIEDLVKMKKQ
ncbi:MAG: hypothetical protein ACC608_00655 [Anaerofustis sp.]